nr:flagellin [uncultured Tyzzerella sp.]
MAMNTVINTNMRALTAHRNLSTVGARQNKANQRLSSGKKINSAADDAAGLAISEKMKAQIKGLDMASKNSEDAISLIQTAEGSLTEVNNMLTRVRELTVQAANDTNQQEDRVKIAEEVAQLLTEIDSISSRTEFNEKKLNDGSFQDGFFQIGANAGQKLDLGIGNMSVSGIGIDKIKDTFGIEKSVDLDPKAGAVGVLSEGVKSSVTGAAVADKVDAGNIENNKNLGTGTVEFKVKIDGVEQSLKFDVDLSSVKTETAGNKIDANKLLNAVVSQLNKNSEFSKNFTVSNNNKQLIITANKEGGDITFVGSNNGALQASDIKLTINKNSDAPTNGAIKSNLEIDLSGAGQLTNGHYGEIDFNNLEDGDTITIGGKTYTKVADADTAKITYGGFSSLDELQQALAADGVNTTKTNNNKSLTLDFANEDSPLAGTYSVNAKDVSDKGKEFSDLLDSIDESLKTVTTQRSKLGANQNRLEYTINNLNITSENLSAAKSRIEDTDMAKEMMNLTSANVLQQAATSMLAQANQAPQSITQLLG